MKIVTIEPVEKPRSFADTKFTEAEWNAAKKTGQLTVPYGVAMRNIKASKGMYRIKPEPKPEMEVKVAGLSVEEMPPEQLIATALSLGLTVKKGIGPARLRQAVRLKMDEMVAAMEAEEEDDDEEEQGGAGA